MKERKDRKQFIRELYSVKDPFRLVGVYQITCLNNGRFYIGSSSDIGKRWKVHKFDLENKVHANFRIQKDYDELGGDLFVFSVIQLCPQSVSKLDLLHLEQHFVDTLFPEYNIVTKIAPKKSKILSYKDPTFRIPKPKKKKSIVPPAKNSNKDKSSRKKSKKGSKNKSRKSKILKRKLRKDQRLADHKAQVLAYFLEKRDKTPSS